MSSSRRLLLAAARGGGGFTLPVAPHIVTLTTAPHGGWSWFRDPRACEFS